MWPQALQMTRDECRGILRRLELESYSHVISVFRAQGGLSENKAKLLEELRGIFHITQERHRAEARRVANDEQLATIAEAISGPNTWQEWSREGRRSFPLLPRVAPQTALALIANSVAAEAAAENAKLPYPAETSCIVAAEQAARAQQQQQLHSKAQLADDERMLAAWNIVGSDPFKVPDIPSAPKKTLKRHNSDAHSASVKRRNMHESAANKTQQQQRQQANSATATTNSNIRKLYNSHNSKMQQQQQQQQRTQQQQQKPKSVAKRSGGLQAKRPLSAKSKRAQALKQQQQQQLQEQQQQEIQQQQQLEQQQQQQALQQNQQHETQQLLTQQQQTQQHHQTQKQFAYEPPPQHQQHPQPQRVAYLGPMDMDLEPPLPPSTTLTLEEHKEVAATVLPQIAASKKDISKNLTKLHLTQQPTTVVAHALPLATRIIPMDAAAATSPSAATALKCEKQLISTPVQKYIVEERHSSATHASGTSQMLSLTATASKLRTMNTTILPPGTKLSAKKLPINTAAAAVASATTTTLITPCSEPQQQTQQLFNIIEGTTITTTTTTQPAPPTHTPPAVIQLNSSSSSTSNNNSLSAEQSAAATALSPPTQGKVLTTKLLPIVLSGTSSGGTKIETLNNGATIVASSTSLAATVNAAPTSSSTATVGSVFKNLPASMIVSATAAGGTHAVFRKPPNIIKTGIIMNSVAGTKLNASSASGSGAQIISNIKLTPANAATSAQQFLKNVTTSGIRTSVKICHSPNGKMFIQPANMSAEALKSAKLQAATLQHKFLHGTSGTATAGGGVTTTTTTPQRIAIQKVQIIPAPMSSPGSLQHQQQQKVTTQLSNKANMIFMPTTCVATRAPTSITLAKGSSLLPKSTATQHLQQQQQQQQQHLQIVDATPKQNVFVIGAVASQQTSSQELQTKSNNNNNNNNNQMITEDTPVDILNMPIIVEQSVDATNKTVGNNIGDTVTVLSNDAATANQSTAIVLGVTDWEMELDQATAVAAASRAARNTQHKTRKTLEQQQKQSQQQHQQQQHDDTIVVDDNYDDVIVEETFIDEDETTTTNAATAAKVAAEVAADVAEDKAATAAAVDDAANIIVLTDKTTTQQQLPAATAQYDDMDIKVVEVKQQQQLQHQHQHQHQVEKRLLPTVATAGTQLTMKTMAQASTGDTHYVDDYDATDIDENTAIEYIEEDHNELYADDAEDEDVDEDKVKTLGLYKSNNKMHKEEAEEHEEEEDHVLNKADDNTAELLTKAQHVNVTDAVSNNNIKNCPSNKETSSMMMQTEISCSQDEQ